MISRSDLESEIYREAERYADAYLILIDEAKSPDELIRTFGLELNLGESVLAGLMIAFAKRLAARGLLDEIMRAVLAGEMSAKNRARELLGLPPLANLPRQPK